MSFHVCSVNELSFHMFTQMFQYALCHMYCFDSGHIKGLKTEFYIKYSTAVFLNLCETAAW